MRVTFPLIPAASTAAVSVQVSGFEDIGLLTHCGRLLCGSCSSGQCFACSFLRIPPRDGHSCRSANRSPCRVDSGLAPPSHPVTTTWTGTAPVTALRAMPGAPKTKKARNKVPGFCRQLLPRVDQRQLAGRYLLGIGLVVPTLHFQITTPLTVSATERTNELAALVVLPPSFVSFMTTRS